MLGFNNIVQSTQSGQAGNQQIMEYLRKIVPRMFQNTLSLLSRQIIQQFLDELVSFYKHYRIILKTKITDILIFVTFYRCGENGTVKLQIKPLII